MVIQVTSDKWLFSDGKTKSMKPQRSKVEIKLFVHCQGLPRLRTALTTF